MYSSRYENKVPAESSLLRVGVDLSKDYDADSIHLDSKSYNNEILNRVNNSSRFDVNKLTDLRFAGIDAPETSHGWGQPFNQAYGKESTKVLTDLLRGKEDNVYLRLAGKVDVYGRPVAELFTKDDKGKLFSINQELVKRGAAYINEDFPDENVATPQLKAEYQQKLNEAIANPPKEGLFAESAILPKYFRGDKGNNLHNWNTLPNHLLYNLGLLKYPKVLSNKRTEVVLQNYGINNEQLTPFFNSDSKVKFIIPSQYGSSFFYERAIYAANRERAGLSVFNITETQGPATSAYLFSYMNKNAGQLPKTVPWYVSNYDKEMATPGLSYYINKEAIKNGWGRIYQEEKGPLASLAGAIGKVLDNSLIYYGNATPDYIRRQQEINPTGSYSEPPAGFFQSTLSFATNFVVQTTQSVLTYFLLGIPFGIATSEMFKASYQGLVDVALSQNIGNAAEKSFLKYPLFQKLATGVVIGFDQMGQSPKNLKTHLWEETKGKGRDVKDIYKPGFNSLISGINLMQNQKAAVFFDYTIRPFIEDVINPYNPRSNANYKGFQKALDNFKTVATSYIYGSFDSDDPTKARFVLQNDGFEKAKKIAEALDTLGSYMPANPMKWGLLGRNYDQVNISFDGSKIVTKDFLALNEVFNFQELLHNLERIYYGGEFLTIVNKGTYVDETGSSIGNIVAKGKSAMAVPKSLLGKAAQLVGVGIQRIFRADGLSPIIQAHHKLRNLEIELYKKNLDWDDVNKTRTLSVGTTIESKGNLDTFLQGVLDYEETLAGSNNKLKITRDFMIEKAATFYGEQEFAQTKIRNPFVLITNNKFLNNRNKYGLLALGTIGAHFALDDMMRATTGASLVSQAIMAVMHRDTGVTPDFAQTSVFGTGVYGSAAYSGFAIAAGYGAATVGQFYSPNIDRYQLTPDAIEHVNNKFNVKAGQKAILAEVLKDGILTNVRPKGNFLGTMAWTTVGLLAARAMGQWAVSSGLRFVQGIPFIGEALLGKGNQKVNDNLSLVAQLTSIRKDIMDRIAAGEKVSSYEAVGAAQLGIMIAAIPIVDPRVQPKDTRVTANQSPLPYFQFFDAASTKGRQYDNQGNLIRSGELSWKIGLQTAPILGTNISFSNPFTIDFDSKNALGFNGVLRYSQENDNIINHISALGGVTFNAGLFTTSMLGTFHLMELTTKLPGINKLNTKGQISNEIKDAVSFTKNSFKWIYGAADAMLALPSGAMNFVRVRYEFNKIVFNTAKDLVASSVNNTANSKGLGKFIKSAGIGYLIGAVAGAGAKFLGADFTTEMVTMASVGVLSTIGLGTASQHISKLSPIGTALKGVTSNLPKIPYLKNKSSSYLLMMGTALAASWLATDSTFGVAVNMDKQNKNPDKTDWVKKLTTVGILTALAVPVLELADIGKSPVQILREYERGLDYLGKPKNYFNPVNLVRQPYVTYKNYVHRSYLNKVLELTTSYRDTSGVQFIGVDDLASSGLTDVEKVDAINKVKTGDIRITSNVMTDKPLVRGLEALWAKSDFVSVLNKPRIGRKFLTLAFGYVALQKAAQGIITGYGATQGRSGQSAVDAFYDAVTIDPIANVFKLLSGYDKKVFTTVLDSSEYTDSTGRSFRKLGMNLLNPNDPNQQTLNKLFQDVFAPYTINPQNSYQSILPSIGITIRQGDFGVRYSYYFQTQSALQDTSFAMFSNLPSYMFALALQGNNQYKFLVEEGLKKAQSKFGNDRQLLARYNVLAALGASAEMAPLNKPRKVSAPYNESTLEMIAGNSVISRALSLRVRRTTELSYSNFDSIRSRMIDYNDPSILSTYSNVVDISNPLAALSSNIINQGQLALMDTEKLMKTIMAIFANNNRISLTNFEFTKEKDRPLSISNQSIDEPGEVLATGGNLGLDTNNLDERPWWGIFGNMWNLAMDKLEGVPEPIKLGIGGAVGLGVGFVALGYYGSLAYAPQDIRLEEAVSRLYNMFDMDDTTEAIYNFKVTNRVVGNGKGGYSLQIQGKNGRQFWIPIPKGMDQSQAKDSLTKSIQHVQLTINEQTKSIYQSILNLTNNDLLDQTNTNNAIGKWNGRNRYNFIYGGLLPDGSKTPGLYGQVISLVDNYVNNIIDSYTENHLTSLHSGLELNAIDNTKLKLKKEIYALLTSTLEEEISSSATLGDDLLSKFKGVRGQKAADTLAKKIYLTLNTFASRLDNNLLYLQSEDALGYGWRLHNTIIDMAESFGGFFNGDKNFFTRNKQFNSTRTPVTPFDVDPDPNAKVSQETIDNLNNIQRPRIKRRVVFGEGVAKGFDIFGKLMTVADALDTFTAYNRLAAYRSDGNRTEGEVNFAATNAGIVTVNAGIGMILSETILKRLPEFSRNIGKSAIKNPGKAGLLVAGLITAGVVLHAGWKAVSEQYNSLTNWVGESDIYKATTNTLGAGYEAITTGIGKGLIGLDNMLSRIPGVSPGAAISMIGAGLTLGTLAFSLAAVGVTAPVIAAWGAVGLLAGGAMSFFPDIGQMANNFLTPAMDWASQIPVVGGLLGSHSSQPIMFTKFGYEDAPIYVATAEQAIAYDSAKSIEASSDWSGKRTASLFGNKSFSGDGYRSDEPAAKLFGKQTINMISSLIDREAAVRGQYYNQAVIGSITWGKMIRSSPNYKELQAFTNLQSKGDPVVRLKVKAAQAQCDSDINKLKCNSSSRLKGSEANQVLTATIVAIAKSNSNTVQPAGSAMRKSVLVNSKDVTNNHLQSQTDQVVAAHKTQPVLMKTVKAEMVNGKVQMNVGVADNNSQQLSVTRGLVSNHNVMPGYS
jgi:endonuclease YncB( thermonuclease family)